MPLADAVAGALRPGQRITWHRVDGTPEDLTGATLTGQLRDLRTDLTRAIAGSLAVQNGPEGVFDWNYGAADVPHSVEDTRYEVQFTATFGTSPTPARHFVTTWMVRRAL